ncbi:MAG: HD domain-containing phosphohydrolase [Candidatus Nitrospinota bacterium M3_3B_026]
MSDGLFSVLVVDDEVPACLTLERFLQKRGYGARSVHTGEEAVRSVKESAPDIVVLDIKMPGMDGIETLKRIRKINEDMVVIMLTALDDVETALITIREGADDFLRKPVVLPELEHYITSALEKRRLVRENRDYQENLEKKVAEQTAELRSMNEYLKKTNLEIVRSLSEAIEAKDPYTRGHCRRVTNLSMALARKAGIDDGKLETLEYGCLLHDIGKIGVRGAVLNKPGRLTPEEFEHVKKHSEIGDRIIASVDFLRSARMIVRNHHERYDGKGYPDGLKGDGMSDLVKISVIVDAYDAMTSDRPYRTAMSVERALSILKENAGSQFDPELVEIFIREKVYLEAENDRRRD